MATANTFANIIPGHPGDIIGLYSTAIASTRCSKSAGRRSTARIGRPKRRKEAERGIPASGGLRGAEKQFDRPGGGQKPGRINPKSVVLWQFLCYAVPGATDKRQAVCPPAQSGALLGPLILRKGGCQMVTYSDLIQTGILIVGIIALFLQANKKK